MSNKGLPLVSVLIPCYNAERWIAETLESVLAQTWSNLEIIVVDDGSTDQSVSVIEAFDVSRVKLIKQRNAGAAAARNRAFHESTGEFVQYLDADDLLSPRKIELQMARLVDAADCVASAEWARFWNRKDEAIFSPDDTWQDLSPTKWLINAWQAGGGMLYPALWLAPRQILVRAGPWRADLSVNDDGEFFTRVLLASRQVLFCPGALTYYRSGLPGSLSGMKSRKGWESQYQAIELCEGHLLAHQNDERSRRACAMLWQRLAHGSYPYHPGLANRALTRASRLHHETIEPEGGATFRVISRALGWKAARVLQRLSGRP